MNSFVSIAIFAALYSTVRGVGVQLPLPPPSSLYESQYYQIFMDEKARYPVMLYTASWCSLSRWSKGMLNARCPSLQYAYRDYDQVPGAEWVFKQSVRLSNTLKLPQVYVCGNLIGGRAQLEAMQQDGSLNQRLSQCTTATCSPERYVP